jgi:tetratricopeptide (TPR) repeat protein
MGLLCLLQNDQEGAAKYFSAAANLDSRSYFAHYYAARAAFMGREGAGLQEAETHLRRAIEINPQFAPAYDSLATLLMMNDKGNQEALNLALKASALEPGVLGHKLNTVRILLAMNRIDEAAAMAEKAVSAAKTESDHSAAEATLLVVQRYQAQVAEQNKRLEEEAANQKEWEELRRRGDEERARAQEARENRQRAEREAALQQQAKITAPENAPAKVPARSPAKTSAGVPARQVFKMDGKVLNVACSAPYVMNLTIVANGRQYRFHSGNFYKVQFWTLGENSAKSNFQPCTELKNVSVQLEYLEAPGKEYRGDIVSISVRR